MDSQDGDQTRKQTSHPVAMGSHPVAMGYPPVGYPPPSQGAYPGYPNTSNGYSYSAPTPPVYFNNPHPASSYDSVNYSIVSRLIFTITTAVIMFTLFLFLVMLVLRPNQPLINIDTLSVSNFTINDSRLDAKWDLSFEIVNQNTKFDVGFNDINVLIFSGKNLLSTTALKPLLLEKKNRTSLHGKLVTMEHFVDDEVEEERKSGFLAVSVRVSFTASFRNGGAAMMEQKLSVVCENLRAHFEGNTGNGKLDSGPWACLHYEIR